VTDDIKLEGPQKGVRESAADKKLRFIVDAVIMASCFLFGGSLYFGGLYELFAHHPDWMIEIIKTHFAGLIIPPLMMVGAIVVVIALRMSEGPIKLKAFGIEFEGAAAPLIMWSFIYLVLLMSVKELWNI